MVLPRSRLGGFIGVIALVALGASNDAAAARFALGVATDFTPIVIDTSRVPERGPVLRLGFRPVLDVELSRFFAFGAFAPFTVYRTSGSGAASSGAESIFGLTISGRYPILREHSPEEILAYGSLRGGFGTVYGRAGPFVGGALGVAATWLGNGGSLFAELGVNRVVISGVERVRDVERTLFLLSIGIAFRLGGEGWTSSR